MIRATRIVTENERAVAPERDGSRLAWLLAALVAAAAPAAAVAFLAAPAGAQAQERRLEEVVVTAQKREESLQDAPLAVTALSGDDLKSLGVIEIGNATKAAPNFTLRRQTASHSNYAFGVRGVSAGETALAVDSVVGLYIDGVYLGRMTGSAFDIADTERVEILRGPQGTLYGRNAVGGAINIITNKPQGELGFSQDIKFTDEGLVRSQTTVETDVYNLGIAELSARLSYAYWEHAGHIENQFRTGTPGVDRTDKIGDIESHAIKFALHGELGFIDGLSFDYSYDNSEKDGNPQLTQILGVDNFTGGRVPNSIQPLLSQALAVSSVKRSGVLHNRYAQNETSDISGHAFTLNWDISENTTFKFIASSREWDSGIPNTGTDFASFYYAPAPGQFGRLIDPLGIQNSQTLQNLGINVTNDGSYSALVAGGGFVDAGQLVSLFRASRTSHQEQSTYELQLLGNLFEERLDYVVGLYYFEEEASEDNSQYTAYPGSALAFVGGVGTAYNAADLTPTQQAILSAIYPGGHTFQGFGSGALCGDSTLNPANFATDVANGRVIDLSATYGQDAGTVTIAGACYGTTVLGGSDVFQYTTDNDAWAAYTQLNYALRDDLDVAVGLRYTEDGRSATLRYSGLQSSPGATIDTVPASAAFDKFTWDVALNLQLSADQTLYGRVATGYRAGGFNVRAPTAAVFQKPFTAENSTSYELGLKGEWMENTMRLNLAWFYTIYKDRQLSNFSPSLAGATSIISNAGEQINQGFEVEATYLTPIDGLTVGANYGYVDAYFSKEPASAMRQSSGGARIPGGAVPYAPRHTLFAWLSYEFADTPVGPVTFRLDYDYAAKWTLSPAFDIDHEVNAATERGLVNIRLDLTDIPTDQLGLPGEFHVAFFGNNITTEEYREFIIPFGTFDLAIYGELASWGMEASYRF